MDDWPSDVDMDEGQDEGSGNGSLCKVVRY